MKLEVQKYDSKQHDALIIHVCLAYLFLAATRLLVKENLSFFSCTHEHANKTCQGKLARVYGTLSIKSLLFSAIEDNEHKNILTAGDKKIIVLATILPKEAWWKTRLRGYASMRVWGSASMRICGFAHMRVCGYAGMSNWFNKQISKTH